MTRTKNEAYVSKLLQLKNHSFSITLRKTLFPSTTSALPKQPKTIAQNTIVSMDKLTCAEYVDFGYCQYRFGQLSWSESDSNYLDVQFNFSRKMATKSYDWFKISHWQKQISTSLIDWVISWSLQRKTLLQRKTCPQCWYLQCPKTWMNHSDWITSWLTLCIAQAKKYAWLCCGISWTGKRIHLLNSKNLQERKRKIYSNNLSILTIHCLNLYIYSMYWLL